MAPKPDKRNKMVAKQHINVPAGLRSNQFFCLPAIDVFVFRSPDTISFSSIAFEFFQAAFLAPLRDHVDTDKIKKNKEGS